MRYSKTPLHDQPRPGEPVRSCMIGVLIIVVTATVFILAMLVVIATYAD